MFEPVFCILVPLSIGRDDFMAANKSGILRRRGVWLIAIGPSVGNGAMLWASLAFCNPIPIQKVCSIVPHSTGVIPSTWCLWDPYMGDVP